MSDQDPNAPTPPAALTPEEAAAKRVLAEQIQRIDHSVEAIFVTAVAFGRMVPLETHEIGRLCVQAGLRYLEKLVESYHRRKHSAAAGGLAFSLQERTRRQQEIKLQARDFQQVLEEALAMCQQLQGQMNVDDGQTAESGEAPPTVN